MTSRRHLPIRAVILDVQTGDHREITAISTSEYAEGSWACDCQRQTPFGHDEPGSHSRLGFPFSPASRSSSASTVPAGKSQP